LAPPQFGVVRRLACHAGRNPVGKFSPTLIEEVRFARDSALKENGVELSVPP
jgi:hypothetical protein